MDMKVFCGIELSQFAIKWLDLQNDFEMSGLLVSKMYKIICCWLELDQKLNR